MKFVEIFLSYYRRLTLPAPSISESCIKIKNNLNFYFHFFVEPQKVLWRP